MKVHELKLWPEFYAPLQSGDKRFELRKDDRGFRAGDELVLREWDPRSEKYTGRELQGTVTYLCSGMGLQPGFVCMSVDVRYES